ncbi:hypothetical protein BDZ94DRAFT_1264817 [Collybia nuda]|uniref:DUF6534 domain-containing protein n=1 Tax=Collybia nuda TaxID=64659 RepID=A0A9P5Y2A8_9AGAR|nr:hypothetical protein BDZ94DRAFT_1264817 [Collybia nuda]
MPWNMYQLALFSSWFNLCLYSFELCLVTQYFWKFSKDARWIHYMVIVMLLADTVGTIASCTTTWTFIITYSMAPIMHHLWTMPALMITTAMTAMMEESFLIYRILSLSKARLVSGFLMLLVATHVVFKIIAAGYIIDDPSFVANFGSTATKIAYCVEAAVDILIPMALVWRLRKVNPTFQSTKSLLRQVSLQAFSSGCVVALVGITFLALFWTQRREFIVITNSYGRIYTVTVLMNLLARQGVAAGEKGAPSNGGNISRLFDVDLSVETESIAPNDVITAPPPSTLVGFKENKELVSQQSDETLRMV